MAAMALWKWFQPSKQTSTKPSPDPTNESNLKERATTTSSTPYRVIMADDTTEAEMSRLVREVEARVKGSTSTNSTPFSTYRLSSTNGGAHDTKLQPLKGFNIDIPVRHKGLVDVLRQHPQVSMVSDESTSAFHYLKRREQKEKCDPCLDAWHLEHYAQLRSQHSTPLFIVDSKIAWQHPEFEANQIHELTHNGSLLDCQAPLDSKPTLCTETHGTFVASMVAGKTLGLVPGYNVISVPFQPHEPITPSRVVDALRSIRLFIDANPSKAQCKGVVNLSIGSTKPLHVDAIERIQYEIDTLRESSVLLVAAAGNDKYEPAHRHGFPGRLTFPLVVGSVNQDKWESAFSSSGHRVDLFAPGEVCGASGEGYEWGVGTSFASPIVCGLALQFLSHHPDLDASRLKDTMIASATYEAVKLRDPSNPAHASPFATSPSSKCNKGWGRTWWTLWEWTISGLMKDEKMEENPETESKELVKDV